MRLPGTLKEVLKQVKASPIPVASISVPTERGPLVLTFVSPPAPAHDKAAAVPPTTATNGTSKSEPKRARTDVQGAFEPVPA